MFNLNLMINVICVDAHPIVLEGLKKLLSNRQEIRLAGYYRTGREALQALDEQVLPQIMLADVNLPDTSGVQLCMEVKKRCSAVKVITLSQHSERNAILSMLQSGASGYVVATACPEEIIAAIHTVYDDQVYLCSSAQKALNSHHPRPAHRLPSITQREKEVLELVGKGYTSHRIASALSVSPHTIETHRKKLMEKFFVKNMTAVIKLATEYQLL